MGTWGKGKLRDSIESRKSPKFKFEQQGGLSELGLIKKEHM